ncbi:MAG: TlpA disulfide reductase family protein [Candidatus Margulisiibacteriota bacterium]
MKKGLALVSILFLLANPCLPVSEKAPVPRNKTAFNFELKDLSGKAVKLSDYKGKFIFLNFFASWCPPCREEMPSIQRLYEKTLSWKGFKLIVVSVDAIENDARAFIKNGKYTFPVLLDSGSKAADNYGIRGIPATFIINKKGKIVDTAVGGRDWANDEMIRKFKTLTGN